jgi:hypothetical protein
MLVWRPAGEQHAAGAPDQRTDDRQWMLFRHTVKRTRSGADSKAFFTPAGSRGRLRLSACRRVLGA